MLTGTSGGLAVRVSAHPVIRALSEQAGPLVSTSANPAGAAPARTALRVRYYFATAVDYVIPGAVSGGGVTEIRDAMTGAVLRKAG